MQRQFFKSKIHRATVTEADLNYEGSLTLDPVLMRQADILAHEKISVVNINNGARFETYVIPGAENSGVCCLNGAAARLGQVGDKVILITYAHMTLEEYEKYTPAVVIVDDHNHIVKTENTVLV
jgi:aspartate 1-decarboxylase